MERLQLTFSGRRTNQESDSGPFVRVNVTNGNIKISPSVINALGLQAKDKINIVCVDKGEAYLAQNDLGSTLSPENTTTSATHAANLKECFRDQLGDNGVLILSVDTDNVIPAADEAGNPINAVKLEFKQAQPSRGSRKGQSVDDADDYSNEASEEVPGTYESEEV